MADRAAEEEILRTIGEKEADARVLMMTDGGRQAGFVAVDIVGDTLRMLKFVLYNQLEISDMDRDFFLDTLMRSAASYGETKGASKLATTDSNMNEFLRKKGFEIDDCHAFAPMSLIVHYE